MRVPSFFRNPETGEIVVAQAPNLSLGVFLGATAVRLVSSDGVVGTVALVVGTGALVWWSVDEMVRGDSPFRRVLGGVVLAVTVVGVLRD